MAKAKLLFDLSDSDDAMEFRRINKSLDMAMSIWEITYNLRKQIERELEAKDSPESDYDLLYQIFGKINEVFNDHNINIDDLIN
jgi:hypothetical protein